MRSVEEVERDAARLERCAELDGILDNLTRRHHGRTPEELAQQLQGDEGDRLRQLLDEVREWSRESRAVEVQR